MPKELMEDSSAPQVRSTFDIHFPAFTPIFVPTIPPMWCNEFLQNMEYILSQFRTLDSAPVYSLASLYLHSDPFVGYSPCKVAIVAGGNVKIFMCLHTAGSLALGLRYVHTLLLFNTPTTICNDCNSRAFDIFISLLWKNEDDSGIQRIVRCNCALGPLFA